MSTKTTTSGKPAPGKSSSSKGALVPITGNPAHNGQCVSVEEIRLTAYQKWEAAGKPDGDGVRFWVEAEKELSQAKGQN